MDMKCPICGKSEKKQPFGSYIWCNTCTSLFLQHPPAQKSIQQQSDDYAEIIFETDEEQIGTIDMQRIKDLSMYIQKKSKILDVGCGNGIFLSHVAKKGYIPFAMDIAPKIIHELKKKGIKGYTKMSQISSKSFEVVTAFDVIEHTTDPRKFMRDIKRILKKNGVIMLTTPNLTGISGRILKTHWWAFGPDGHYVLFSPQSLKRLLEQNGFQILLLKTDSFTQWFVPSNTLLKKTLNKLLYMFFSIFKEYAYSHNFGDNIQIIAKMTSKIDG